MKYQNIKRTCGSPCTRTRLIKLEGKCAGKGGSIDLQKHGKPKTLILSDKHYKKKQDKERGFSKWKVN